MPAFSFQYVLLELEVERKFNNVGATVEFYELLTVVPPEKILYLKMVMATEGLSIPPKEGLDA